MTVTKKCRIKGCNGKATNDQREGLKGLCAEHVESQRDRERKSGEHEALIRRIWQNTKKP